LGYNKEEFLYKFFTNLNDITWIEENVNFEELKKIAQCSDDQFLKIFNFNLNSSGFCAFLGVENLEKQKNILSDEILQKLLNSLPTSEYLNSLYITIKKTGLTIASIRSILQFLNEMEIKKKESKKEEEHNSLLEELKKLYYEKEEIEYCFEKLQKAYELFFYRMQTLSKIAVLLEYNDNHWVKKFTTHFKKVQEEKVMDIHVEIDNESRKKIEDRIKENLIFYEHFCKHTTLSDLLVAYNPKF